MAAPAAAGSWRPSLKFFLLRSQSIGLYRRLLRAARGAPDPGTRDAIREQIRASYEANRGVRDEELMRHLLEDAKKSLKKLEEMVGMAR
eukprot:tig00020812_g14084.t1